MNIVEAVNKLQNIDVKDLKNIDLANVQDNLKGKPDILIIIGLILVSLSATIYLYTNSKNSIKELDAEHVVLTEMMEAANLNKALKIKYETFISEFPEKIPVDNLVNIMSGFAINHDIKIISFSPANEQKSDYMTIGSVNINIQAKQYLQLIEFLDDIENAPFAIRIENISANLVGKKSQRSRRGRQPVEVTDEVPIISANIKIAAIALDE